MLRWPRADRDLTWPDGAHRPFNPHLRCRGKRHRFSVAGVEKQRRRHPGICEQIGDHSPLGHTVVPIQRVLRKLAAVPHFFQLRLFVRPASLALHVYVDIHGFSLPSGEKPRNDQKSSSDSEAVLVASTSQMRSTNRIAGDWPDGREACVGVQVFPTRSRGCKLRGGPKISRRIIAPRKPDFDASKVAMSVLKSAPLATPKAFGAA
jgi:hypothetical protein